MALELNSPAFDDGQPLPRKYAHGGDNASPPLHWSGPPAGVQSFMVLMEDPDAPRGVFRHWAIYDIPPDHLGLPEGAGRVGQPTGRQAINDFGEPRYDGPEPPIGDRPHRYVFRLLALAVAVLHTPRSPRVLQAMEAARAYILAEAELTGTYRR
jgi:hypothetical protein